VVCILFKYQTAIYSKTNQILKKSVFFEEII